MLLRQPQQRKRAGFTLMEIIVVVAIILILASAAVVVIPKFIEDANFGRARMDVKTLEKAVMSYYAKYHRLPDNLEMLAQRQEDGTPAYIEHSALKDPW